MVATSKKLMQYFEDIDSETKRALKKATSARLKSYDPEDKVDVPIAKNMAERVLGLVSAVAPQLVESNIVDRIVELEKEYAPLDWRVGFKIAEEVALQKFCTFEDKKEAAEVGIRTGFMYLTGGIVSAPLEGFVGAKIKQRADGKEYLASIFAGPIRGAGGTAAATCVILSDYVATKVGYAKYDPTDEEVARAVTELQDYHERITNLQYYPSEEEIRFMVKNLPVEVDGEPTERIEVSNNKDLKRVESNLIRGGICLVIGEGLCQKAPKLWKRLSEWGLEFGIDWTFLEEFLALQKKVKAKGKKKVGTSKISKNFTFINDIVAGRPILTHPMAYGGFRIRMGRTRTSGFSCVALNPYTLQVLDDYIVYGTQIKIERPGKAASVTVCECIEGPTVLLKNGNVLKITKETKDQIKNIKKILFLGDVLINYGDFSENGHPLVPAGYCPEWWAKEIEKQAITLFQEMDYTKLSSLVKIESGRLKEVLENALTKNPTFEEAVLFSKYLDVPFHPEYTYYYSSLSNEQLLELINSFEKVKLTYYDNEQTKIKSLIFNSSEKLKEVFENIGLPHQNMSGEFLVVADDDAKALSHTFNITDSIDNTLNKDLITKNEDKTSLEIINLIAKCVIRDKAGTFMGARMGRPEKAKMRKLQGSPQVLFPVGEEGGRMRSFQSSATVGEITAEFPIYYDEEAKKRTVYKRSHLTDKLAKKIYFNPGLNKETVEEIDVDTKEKNRTYNRMTINIKEYIDSSLKILKTRVYPDLIKGVKGTSNKDHIPEHLVKGFIRAKYDLYVNKDGTTRYDMSESPMTAFKPKEIGTSIEKLKELGYTKDINDNPLEDENQVVGLFPQDVVLPSTNNSVNSNVMEEQADDVMFRIGLFVDELLEKLYKEKPFYKFKTKKDVIGSLIICLAPHISCGTVGRVIGFSKNQVMIAHPMMHAAVRRDCDGDEACFIMLMDAFLNFSRQYLPDRRGSRTMDAPLVLSSRIIPSEVDDQVHGLDVVRTYPLELYEAALEYKMPWEVKVEQLNHRLGTVDQYEHFYSTHPVGNINTGPKVSSYKILPSMQEKLDGQMALATKIAAVDESNVATMVIQKHFLKDIKGNLRKFSMQQFRCVKCNAKYRRPPLVGKCTTSKCDGRIIFTISEGSVIKYLAPSLELANKFNVSPYLKQTLQITQDRVDSVFGKEKEIQQGLGDFM